MKNRQGVRLLLTPEDYEFHSGRSFAEDYAPRRCAYCGTTEELTTDHVMPKSRGGTNDPDNLVLACRDCNMKKGARTPAEAGMSIRFEEGRWKTKPSDSG